MRTPEQRRTQCDWALLVANVWCAALAVLIESRTMIVTMALVTLVGWTVLEILSWCANRLDEQSMQDRLDRTMPDEERA